MSLNRDVDRKAQKRLCSDAASGMLDVAIDFLETMLPEYPMRVRGLQLPMSASES
jgi:hypothetical protein